MARFSKRELVSTTFRYTCKTCGKTERNFPTRPLAARAAIAHINRPGNSAHKPQVFTDVTFVSNLVTE